MGKGLSGKKSQGLLLFEIGVEELPLHHWDNVENGEWEERSRKLFSDFRLSFDSLQITTTPRRIVFLFRSVPSHQKALEKVFRGPSLDKAYDASGKPTEAMLGFARSKGIALETLVEEKTEKGSYVVAKIQEPAKATIKVLPDLLKQLTCQLTFPKNMRWEPSGLRFSRPIRWLLALYDNKPLSFEVAGVCAKPFTRGHRFLSPKLVKITRIEEFESVLARHHVVLCREKRKEISRRDLTNVARTRGWDPDRFDTELVAEVSDLVEDPFLITGNFDKKYLTLPSEVLSTCMKKHQKIFACYDKKGTLVPQFIAVINGRRKNTAKISEDYRDVLESRLRDAQFFFHEDTRSPLAEKAEKLKGIIFLGKLGTVFEKTERMKKLALFFADELELSGEEKKKLERAAALSKADLVTQVVYEFPELQGVMGREYALHDGEDPQTSRAIDAQYWPKSLGIDHTILAQSVNRIGGLLAIVEKIDTLVGAFGSGLIPTGSQDPYALRRASGGIVKLIRAFGFSFSLSRLITKVRELYGNKIGEFNQETESKLKQFFKERLFFELNLKPGSRDYEILQAVEATQFDDLSDVFKRYGALQDFSRREGKRFLQAAKVVERTSNILKGIKGSVKEDVNEGLFQESLEKDLLALYRQNEAQFIASLERKDYGEATRCYGDVFYEPLHQFFDTVMVNVEDPNIRANRQALMKKINALYVARIADLSCLSNLEIQKGAH